MHLVDLQVLSLHKLEGPGDLTLHLPILRLGALLRDYGGHLEDLFAGGLDAQVRRVDRRRRISFVWRNGSLGILGIGNVGRLWRRTDISGGSVGWRKLSTACRLVLMGICGLLSRRLTPFLHLLGAFPQHIVDVAGDRVPRGDGVRLEAAELLLSSREEFDEGGQHGVGVVGWQLLRAAFLQERLQLLLHQRLGLVRHLLEEELRRIGDSLSGHALKSI